MIHSPVQPRSLGALPNHKEASCHAFSLLHTTTYYLMGGNRNVRKFIDLVRRVSGKWTNWDPPIPIKVTFPSVVSMDHQR